ncbi:MAG: hypothetical protein ACFE8L_11355 [Candidatus Hodarchaeota archaeon]
MVKVKFRNLFILSLLSILTLFSCIPIGRATVVYDLEFNIVDAQVNNYTTNNQKLPSICLLTNETLAIVWESYGQDGGENGVYGTVIDATTGNNITSEFRVNDYTSYNQAFASICALSSEVVAIAWSSWNQDGSFWGVYTKVYNVITHTSLTPEIPVNEYTSGYQYEPSICALSNDSFAIAWQSNQDAGSYDVYARVFNATTGSAITGEFRVNNFTTGSQQRPSICSLSQDAFAVAWESSNLDGDGYGVFGVVIDAATGNNLTKQFQINDYTINDQWFCSACALDNENIAVAWRSNGQDGSGYGVYATVIDTTTGNNITAELQMNQENFTSQQNPSICALSSDLFIVAWESASQDGDGYGVYMRAVNVTTSKSIVPEYQVNNYTTGNQWYSGICALSNKDVAIVWESDGQDGDGYGIYLSTSTLASSILSEKSKEIPGYNLYIMISVIGLVIGTVITVKLRKNQKKDNT